ncbi:MAG: hypothetical protein JW829_09445, partial [Pirellulales bacterium]|nr:hypothetical protein [Pirellulales bacterium]
MAFGSQERTTTFIPVEIKAMFCSLRKIIVFSAINVAISATLHAGDPNRLMAPIAPFLDEQAILVAHVDLTQIDPDAVVANVLKLVPLKESDIAELKKQAGIAKNMLDAFIKAGGREIFSVFSLADLSNLGHEPPGFVVVPVAAGGDPNA